VRKKTFEFCFSILSPHCGVQIQLYLYGLVSIRTAYYNLLYMLKKWKKIFFFSILNNLVKKWLKLPSTRVVAGITRTYSNWLILGNRWASNIPIASSHFTKVNCFCFFLYLNYFLSEPIVVHTNVLTWSCNHSELCCRWGIQLFVLTLKL